MMNCSLKAQVKFATKLAASSSLVALAAHGQAQALIPGSRTYDVLLARPPDPAVDPAVASEKFFGDLYKKGAFSKETYEKNVESGKESFKALRDGLTANTTAKFVTDGKNTYAQVPLPVIGSVKSALEREFSDGAIIVNFPASPRGDMGAMVRPIERRLAPRTRAEMMIFFGHVPFAAAKDARVRYGQEGVPELIEDYYDPSARGGARIEVRVASAKRASSGWLLTEFAITRKRANGEVFQTEGYKLTEVGEPGKLTLDRYLKPGDRIQDERLGKIRPVKYTFSGQLPSLTALADMERRGKGGSGSSWLWVAIGAVVCAGGIAAWRKSHRPPPNSLTSSNP